MSGGSHNYISSLVDSECRGNMVFPIAEELLQDVVEILHSCEWAVSGDTAIEDYQEDLNKFLSKWKKRRITKKDFKITRCSECKWYRTYRNEWDEKCENYDIDRGCDGPSAFEHGYAHLCPGFVKATKADLAMRSAEENDFRESHLSYEEWRLYNRGGKK